MDNLVIFLATYVYLFEIAIMLFYFFGQSRSTQKSIILLSVIFFPLAYIIAQIIAVFYFDPRPFVVGNFTPLISHAPDNGFPSDHMLLTSAIASILCVYNKKIGIVAWIIALVVGLSRVYTGIHHLTDIIGSIVVAIMSLWVVRRYILPKVFKTKLYRRYFEIEMI